MAVSYQDIDGIVCVQVIPEGDKIIIDKSKKIHEQITPDTWCQNLYESRIGNCTVGMCAVGWIGAIYSPAMYNEISDKLEEQVGQLTLWNDKADRKFSEVVELFRSLDI
jgi:hypothetical protein